MRYAAVPPVYDKQVSNEMFTYEHNLEVIANGALRVDPNLGQRVLSNTLKKHVQNNKSAHPLADFVREHPNCFTGTPGAPPRLRLVLKALSEISEKIQRSRCTSCNRVLRTDRAHAHKRPSGFICERCDAIDRNTICDKCKEIRVIASTSLGVPLCYVCTRKHPSSLRKCANCGELREVAKKSDGQPLCPACYKPPQKPCSQCGRVKKVAACRGTQGVVCGTCYKRPERLCSVCGCVGPVHVSRRDGDICTKCYSKPLRLCVQCGILAPGYKRFKQGYLCAKCGMTGSVCSYCKKEGRRIEATLPDGPCCYVCYRSMWADPGICVLCEERRAIVTTLGFCWRCAGSNVRGKVCRTCRNERILWSAGQCEQCHLDKLAADFFSDDHGQMSEQSMLVYKAISATSRPASAIKWLTKSSAAKSLRLIIKSGRLVQIDDFDITNGAMAFARDLYIAAGALNVSPADQHDLQLWLEITLSREQLQQTAPPQLLLVKQYAQWTVFKDFRRIVKAGTAREFASRFARRSIIAAINFLSWLLTRGCSLASCAQHDIDAYFSTRSAVAHDAKKFIKWCERRHHIHRFKMPKRDLGAPLVATQQQRLSILSRLLNDQSIPLWVRVAALLVGLYGQMFGRLRNLKKVDILRDEDRGVTSIAGGRAEPLEVQDPVGQLLWDLRFEHPPHFGIASGVGNPWLFQGHKPGKALSAGSFRRVCRKFGIDLKGLRGAALLDMAADVDLTMVADMLDLCTDTAYRWRTVAGGSWNEYVALRLA